MARGGSPLEGALGLGVGEMAKIDFYRLHVGEGGVQDVRGRVGFGPGDLVYHPSKVQIEKNSDFV